MASASAAGLTSKRFSLCAPWHWEGSIDPQICCDVKISAPFHEARNLLTGFV